MNTTEINTADKTFFPEESRKPTSTEKPFNKMRLSDIRPQRLVYFLAYAFELMLFCARGQFLPIGANLLGIRGWTVVQAAHAIASLVFMLLWSKKFKHLIYISVGLMLAGFIPFVFLPMGIPRALFAVLFYIGLGGAVTSARCGYAFALNNTERLAGMIIMFASVALIRFIRSLGAEGIIVTYILPFALLFGLCLCLLKFKENDFEIKAEAVKEDKKGLYWAFAFFALYFAVDGFNSALVDGYKNPDFLYFFIGMIIAGGVLFVAVAKLKLGTWHIWNIFFTAAFSMGLFAAFAPRLGTQAPQYFFGGLSMVGWPLCIYVLGCAQRRFADYKLLKLCTVLFVALSPVISLLSKLTMQFAPDSLPLVAMLFILIFGIAFLMFSPFSYKHLFSSQWIGDIYGTDMRMPDEIPKTKDRFEGYNLSPRQREIAYLILSAKTGRQIAGELKLSESTVKMHTSELYKKLGISSKTELFRNFGLLTEEEAVPQK